MKIVVGLGNPGKQYEETRHNIGFLALLELAKNLNGHESYVFNGKEKHSLFEADEFLYRDPLSGANEKILLVRPMTFMNVSGSAVYHLVRYTPDDFDMARDLIVFHDDADVDFGKIKLDQDRTSAGHNGVQNIIDQLGSKNFIRLRIGIRPPDGMKGDIETFVLNRFTKDEREILPLVLHRTVEAYHLLAERGFEVARASVNAWNAKTTQ